MPKRETIGADEFPRLQILATGSSTLAATQKFRDSLTGRKRVVEFVPVLPEALPACGSVCCAGGAFVSSGELRQSVTRMGGQ